MSDVFCKYLYFKENRFYAIFMEDLNFVLGFSVRMRQKCCRKKTGSSLGIMLLLISEASLNEPIVHTSLLRYALYLWVVTSNQPIMSTDSTKSTNWKPNQVICCRARPSRASVFLIWIFFYKYKAPLLISLSQFP